MKYTGIGHRNTPENVRNMMTNIGSQLAQMGFILRSGNARCEAASLIDRLHHLPTHLAGTYCYLPSKPTVEKTPALGLVFNA